MKTSLILAVAVSLACGCGKKDEAKKKPVAADADKADDKGADKSATPTEPKEPAISATEVTYKVGDQEFKGYLATPAGEGKAPGVLVVHEWWGHNDYSRRRARMLAEMGYTALAVDMYGDGKQAAHPKDAMAFATAALKDKAVAEARFVAAMDMLKNHPRTSGKLAAIGYCFGGGVVLEMAKRGVALDLFASFHGMLNTATEFAAGDVKGKVFVAHGAADSFIPPETIETFKKQMGDAKVEMEFVAYDGAKHAFTNPEADTNGKKFKIDLAYNKQADEQSWAKLTELLAASLK